MRLLRSEVRRLTGRRMFFWVLLAGIGFAVMLVVINAAQSDANALDPNRVMNTTELWLSDAAALRMGVQTSNRIVAVSVLSYMIVVVLGASAVGAEYRAGTVTTMLTWEPRRVRLLVARLAAAALVSMLFFVIVQVVFVGGWSIGAQIAGRTDGADSDFWRALAFAVLRGTALAGALAVISGALATLGRNTASALALWFGYLVAVEGLLRVQMTETIPWLLTTSAGAFYGWERVTVSEHSVGPGAGTYHLALIVVVIAGLAVLVFQRRDVT